MPFKDATLENYTTKQLIEEIGSRDSSLVRKPNIPSVNPLVTPYEIMIKMIEQGWKEDPEQGESDPRIDRIWDYLGYPKFTDDQSYCAATLNCCLKLAGYKTSEVIPVARSFENYGDTISIHNAKQGDIIVFERNNSSWKGHVGFVEGIDGTTFMVGGGNQSDKICFKNYATNGVILKVSSIRRLTNDLKIETCDYKTLRDWKLI